MMVNRKVIMLTVTESCNLDCVYCYEGQKSQKNMDIEVAKNIITDAFVNSDDFEEIEFDFFGGEPTIQKETIMELVEWSFSQNFNKPFYFFLETNGTLVHGEFQDWLVKHKDHLYVGLSIDGTPETHNKNRSNSYEQIDIDFFAKNYPSQGARMTIGNDTVGNLFNDIMHLHKIGFSKVDAFFAFGVDWSSKTTKEKISREFRKLCDYYLSNPDVPENRLFDIDLAMLIDNDPVKKWCGSGVDIISVAVDGKIYPCHMFQPNSTNTPLQLDNIDFHSIKDFSDTSCSECMLEQICPNCYGMNYCISGDILRRERSLCDITKIRALAVSYLRAKQIEKGILNISPQETYQTIESIRKIQENFGYI